VQAVFILNGYLFWCTCCVSLDQKLIRVFKSVSLIKLDWSVCTCLTQLYDGRDMYIIYYIKNNYMFRHFSLAIFRLRNEKLSKQLY